MSYSTILYQVEDSILTITLNRPEALNAFNNEMLFELIDACDKADADDDVKAIIVTGAAGSVGSIVGQLAKADGLHVIGVVGNEEKADWIVNTLGFDTAINYKSDDLDAQLAKAAPNGIDLFFENTAGPIQNLIVERMNAHGRVMVCGLIADYSKAVPAPGPSWVSVLKRRLTIQGFTMPDHYDQAPELIGMLAPYVMEGKIQHRSHILDGLESAIDGLNLFFSGENKGKLIVKI